MESNTKEILLDITEDKLNDIDYINKKILEVALDTLLSISQNSNNDFMDLIKHFSTEISMVDNEFLSKWNFTKEQLSEKKYIESETKFVEDNDEDKDDTVKKPEIKKISIKKKKPKQRLDTKIVVEKV